MPGPRTWTGLLLAPVVAVCGIGPTAGWMGRTVGSTLPAALTRAKAGTAVGVGTVALLVLFGALFANADPRSPHCWIGSPLSSTRCT